MDESVAKYQEILRKIQNDEQGYHRLNRSAVHFAMGWADMQRHAFDRAMDDFGQVVLANDATANRKANAHLWLGKMYDTSGRRKDAVQEYTAVLALGCDRELKQEASRLQRTPFK